MSRQVLVVVELLLLYCCAGTNSEAVLRVELLLLGSHPSDVVIKRDEFSRLAAGGPGEGEG